MILKRKGRFLRTYSNLRNASKISIEPSDIITKRNACLIHNIVSHERCVEPYLTRAVIRLELDTAPRISNEIHCCGLNTSCVLYLSYDQAPSVEMTTGKQWSTLRSGLIQLKLRRFVSFYDQSRGSSVDLYCDVTIKSSRVDFENLVSTSWFWIQDLSTSWYRFYISRSVSTPHFNWQSLIIW